MRLPSEPSSSDSEVALQRAYQESLAPEKRRLTRILAALTLAVNSCFMGFEYGFVTGGWNGILTVRMVLNLVIALGLAASMLPALYRHQSLIMSLTLLSLGFSVCAMLALSGPADVAHDTYYGALLLITFAAYTLSLLNPRQATVVSVLLILAYLGAALGEQPAVLATQLFLFGTTLLVGFVAGCTRERYAIENFRLRHTLELDVSRQHEEIERAAHRADHDALTGLPNRSRFHREASELLQTAQRESQRLLVLFVDLDGFKPVNDRFGHATGDRVLAIIAERLRKTLRAEDCIGRLGGDEFVVAAVLEDEKPSSVPAISRHLAAQIAEPIEVRGASVTLSASIGQAISPEDGSDIRALLEAADNDMYRLKGRPSAPQVQFTG